MSTNSHDDNIECKLFLGGLSPDTNETSLREYFEIFGEIVDVVVMRNSNTNRSRCFGFVKYATEEQLQESQANRPHVVDGKEIDAKRAVARTNPGIDAQENNRNSGDQRSQNSFVRENQHPSLPKIYVGGIKEGLEEIDLKEYFSTFGLVKSVDIITDKMTGNLRGFAFVKFTDYDAVDKITSKKNHTVKGFLLDTQRAIPEIDKVKRNDSGRNYNRQSNGNNDNERNFQRFVRNESPRNRNGNFQNRYDDDNRYPNNSCSGGYDNGYYNNEGPQQYYNNGPQNYNHSGQNQYYDNGPQYYNNGPPQGYNGPQHGFNNGPSQGYNNGPQNCYNSYNNAPPQHQQNQGYNNYPQQQQQCYSGDQNPAYHQQNQHQQNTSQEYNSPQSSYQASNNVGTAYETGCQGYGNAVAQEYNNACQQQQQQQQQSQPQQQQQQQYTPHVGAGDHCNPIQTIHQQPPNPDENKKLMELSKQQNKNNPHVAYGAGNSGQYSYMGSYNQHELSGPQKGGFSNNNSTTPYGNLLGSYK